MNFTKEFFMAMDAQEIAAQAVGFVAMLLLIVSYQQKTRKGILSVQLIAALLWFCHYGLIGAYTGMALNILGALRCFVYANREIKKWASHAAVPFIFFTLAVVTAGVTWSGPASLLPMAAICITSFVLWSKNPGVIRAFSYPGSVCWLIFNVLSGSYPGVATEIFTLVSITVGILRFDIGKKKKQPIETAAADRVVC